MKRVLRVARERDRAEETIERAHRVVQQPLLARGRPAIERRQAVGEATRAAATAATATAAHGTPTHPQPTRDPPSTHGHWKPMLDRRRHAARFIRLFLVAERRGTQRRGVGRSASCGRVGLGAMRAPSEGEALTQPNARVVPITFREMIERHDVHQRP